MARVYAPIPLTDPIATAKMSDGERVDSFLSNTWVRYFTDMTTRISRSVERIAVVTLTGQAASIAATAIPLATLTQGFYQIAYYTRITQAATTSSSLEIVFDWVDTLVTVTHTGAAITGNTVVDFQTDNLLVLADGASSLRYATTYASVGATPMQYQLHIIASRVTA